MLEEHVREFLEHQSGEWAGRHACRSPLWTVGRGKPDGGSAFNFGGFGGGAGGAGGGSPPFPPFPPFGGFPWSLFRKARAKRGDVRAAILSLLTEKPLNGYQIMQELEQRSRGSWKPSPGAVYPALQQLEDEGLVCAETATGGRTFSLTEKGRSHVQAHPDEFAAPWEATKHTAGDEPMLGLFVELKHIAAASIQVVHTGSSVQIRDAQKILNQARKSLYRLLADDAGEDSDD
jgi:DNA-binding PadR family transcriptional regulator